MVLEEMIVDRFHGEEALVADRADEDLLTVGVRWTRRRGVLGVIVIVAALVLIVVRAVALFVVAAVTIAMEFLRRHWLARHWRRLFRGFDSEVERSVERGVDHRRWRGSGKELLEIWTSSEIQPRVGIEGKGGMMRRRRRRVIDDGRLRQHVRRSIGWLRWDGGDVAGGGGGQRG